MLGCHRPGNIQIARTASKFPAFATANTFMLVNLSTYISLKMIA
jgi:hypothetical protein